MDSVCFAWFLFSLDCLARSVTCSEALFLFCFRDARVVKDMTTGKSKGYGFVSFYNKLVRLRCKNKSWRLIYFLFILIHSCQIYAFNCSRNGTALAFRLLLCILDISEQLMKTIICINAPHSVFFIFIICLYRMQRTPS